jgi:hypothetical protein
MGSMRLKNLFLFLSCLLPLQLPAEGNECWTAQQRWYQVVDGKAIPSELLEIIPEGAKYKVHIATGGYGFFYRGRCEKEKDGVYAFRNEKGTIFLELTLQPSGDSLTIRSVLPTSLQYLEGQFYRDHWK